MRWVTGTARRRTDAMDSSPEAWNHPDNRHHSTVFVLQDVTVIDEVANVRAAKIHSHRHARIRSMPTPVGDVNHVEHLAVLRRDYGTISPKQHEMNLMDMELMG